MQGPGLVLLLATFAAAFTAASIATLAAALAAAADLAASRRDCIRHVCRQPRIRIVPSHQDWHCRLECRRHY